MTTVAQLETALGIKAKPKESEASFAERAMKKIGQLSNDEWETLDPNIQTWNNQSVEAKEQGGEALPLEGGMPNGVDHDAEPTPESLASKVKAIGKKDGGGRRGPPPKGLDLAATITIVSTPDFRVGSHRHEIFSKYRDGMTVIEARDAGVPFNHMRWHIDKGFIKLGKAKPAITPGRIKKPKKKDG